jgi:hypothetical protein
MHKLLLVVREPLERKGEKGRMNEEERCKIEREREKALLLSSSFSLCE